VAARGRQRERLVRSDALDVAAPPVNVAQTAIDDERQAARERSGLRHLDHEPALLLRHLAGRGWIVPEQRRPLRQQAADAIDVGQNEATRIDNALRAEPADEVRLAGTHRPCSENKPRAATPPRRVARRSARLVENSRNDRVLHRLPRQRRISVPPVVQRRAHLCVRTNVHSRCSRVIRSRRLHIIVSSVHFRRQSSFSLSSFRNS
jgi:hypothetical protein